jgi:hypothetical protein
MKEVAKIFDVEPNEDFKCNDNLGLVYRFTENELLCNGVPAAESLMMLLNGTLKIVSCQVIENPWQEFACDTCYHCIQDDMCNAYRYGMSYGYCPTIRDCERYKESKVVNNMVY